MDPDKPGLPVLNQPRIKARVPPSRTRSAAWTSSPRRRRARSSTTAARSTSAAAIASRSSRPIRRGTHRPIAAAATTTSSHSPRSCPRRAPAGARYTCPMHPEVIRDRPGPCPICGMALEPMTVTADDEADPELADMSRRFWVCLVLTFRFCPFHGRDDSGASGCSVDRGPDPGLDSVRSSRRQSSCGAGCRSWGAGWASLRQPPSQYVHLIATWDGERLSLQMVAATSFPAYFPSRSVTPWRASRLFRAGGG